MTPAHVCAEPSFYRPRVRPMARKRTEARGFLRTGVFALVFVAGHLSAGPDRFLFLGVATAFLAGVLLALAAVGGDVVRVRVER